MIVDNISKISRFLRIIEDYYFRIFERIFMIFDKFLGLLGIFMGFWEKLLDFITWNNYDL
jgi:hypothetical protein